MRLDPRIPELLAAVALAGLAFAAAHSAFGAAPAQPFSQSEFGPAVMLAAGQGFVNPEPVPGGRLEDFLQLRASSLDANSIDVARIIDTDQFQNSHRYLLTVVGYWWRVSGISWQRLAEVAGLSHALATLATFGLLRLFVPLAPALIGAIWFATSPLQLTFAPHLRDFVKAPFLLAALVCVVALVLHANSRRVVVMLSAALGVAIGVGLGFRMDVAIMAPIAVACVALFRGRRPWSGLGEKGLVVAVLVLTIVLSAWPVLSRLTSGGSNAFHVVLLGSSDWFDARLGIEPASYSFLPFYSDDYLRHLLRTRAVEATGLDAPMPSAAYDDAAFELWRQWLRHFPADAYTRLLAAAGGVLDLAFDNPTGVPGVPWASDARPAVGWDWLNRWRGWGWVLGIALVLGGAIRGARHALFAAFLMMAVAGYPSLQYDPRHYFHLQAIPIAIIVVSLWMVLSLSAGLVRRGWPDDTSMRRRAARSAGSLAATAALVAAFVVIPVPVLRAYQANHLTGLVSEFLRQELVPMTVAFEPLDDHRWLAHWSDVRGVPSRLEGLSTAYYLAEFRADGPFSAMAIGIRYAAAPDWRPCGLMRALSTSPGTARFIFPAYSVDGESRFEGIELGPEMRRRLAGVYRVSMGPGGLPMDFRLAADWEQRRLFQRLVGEERLRADEVGVGVFAAPDRCASRMPYLDATLDPRLSIAADDIAFVDAERVTLEPAGIAVDGSVDSTATDLLRFHQVTLAQGDALVARVRIRQGGMAIGLLKDGLWVARVHVPRPGLNVVVVPVPESSSYTPALAGADPGWRPGLTFTLDRLGIVGAEGDARPLQTPP